MGSKRSKRASKRWAGAMRETDIQKQLIDECKTRGGWGYKSSTPMLMGVVDMYLALEPFYPCFVEVKFIRKMPSKRIVTVDLTPHQLRFLKRINEHSRGRGSCLVVVSMGHNRYEMEVVPRTALDNKHLLMTGTLEKRHGKPWPIAEIIERVVA